MSLPDYSGHGRLQNGGNGFEWAYLGHHGIRPHACNVARGNEKGRAEDLIKYIRLNFWPSRSFADFDDLSRQLSQWRDGVANSREHRSHRRVVRLLFDTDEKSKLLELNPVPFDTDEVLSRHVPPEFHLQYESNRYSVPWTLVGLTVTVRATDRDIKIFYNEKFICSHQRSYLKNKVFTTETHRAGLIERKPGSTRESWQLGYVKGLGSKMAEYVELVRQGPRSLKNELSRLIALTTVYGEDMVLAAVPNAWARAWLVSTTSNCTSGVGIILQRRHSSSRRFDLIQKNSTGFIRWSIFESTMPFCSRWKTKQGHRKTEWIVETEQLLAGLAELKLKSWTESLMTDWPGMKEPEQEVVSRYLTRWIAKERAERKTQLIQSRIRVAKFRRLQTVENFDFRHSKTTEKIEKTYLALHQSVAKDNLPSAVLTGHAGTGKTHLARALGYAACQRGLTVLFVTAAEMVNRLQHAQKTFNLESELNKYANLRCSLLTSWDTWRSTHRLATYSFR